MRIHMWTFPFVLLVFGLVPPHLTPSAFWEVFFVLLLCCAFLGGGGVDVYALNRYNVANWRSRCRTARFLGQKKSIFGRFALRFKRETFRAAVRK